MDMVDMVVMEDMAMEHTDTKLEKIVLNKTSLLNAKPHAYVINYTNGRNVSLVWNWFNK